MTTATTSSTRQDHAAATCSPGGTARSNSDAGVTTVTSVGGAGATGVTAGGDGVAVSPAIAGGVGAVGASVSEAAYVQRPRRRATRVRIPSVSPTPLRYPGEQTGRRS